MLTRPALRIPGPQAAGAAFRRDIQGLRAVAVGLVVLYHLFPGLLSGGFVGVDVFFVISGYLITGHMVREVASRGRIDLLGFYARRARRLVPAATVVLVATWLAALVVLPGSRLAATAKQVAASALYVQNWILAGNSVNYLTAEDAPSPVQHYWSLSVEEQFYLVWPLLLILATALAAALRWSWRRAAVLIGAAACATSLAASVWVTGTDGAAAYFVTETRVWELGLGALLAILGARIKLPARSAAPARWVGLVLILAAALLYSGATAFPGTAALLPVLGSVLVLAAGEADERAAVLGSRPMTWVGDHSYSLYLVHWPLIVIWEAWSGGSIGALDGPGILCLSLVLAWALAWCVEDPLRRSRLLATRGRGLAVALAAAIPVALAVPHLLPQSAAEINAAAHPGAAARTGDAPAVENSIDTMTPPADVAADDRPDYYDHGCEVGFDDPSTIPCEFGQRTHPALTVAAVGDSKIGQWMPALEKIANERHWLITTYLRARCPWSATRTVVGAGNEHPYDNCARWGHDVLDRLTKNPPDVLLTSDRPAVGIPGHPQDDAFSHAAIAKGMAAYWRDMLAHGTRVVAIRETPEMGHDVPDCLSAPGASLSRCGQSLARAITPDAPTVLAAKELGGRVPVVTMTDLLCGKKKCPVVIGDDLVYRDSHHLTKTYVLSLAPYLEKRLAATGVLTARKG